MSTVPDLRHLTPAKRKTAQAIIAARDEIIGKGGKLTAPAIVERIPDFHPQGKAIKRRQLYDGDYVELWRVPNSSADADDQLRRVTAERNRLRKKVTEYRVRAAKLEKALAVAREEIADRIQSAREQDERMQTLLEGFVEDGT